MNVTKPLPSDVAGIKALWKTGFNESDIFLDNFFANFFIPQNAFILKEGDVTVSSLYANPSALFFMGERLPLACVMGVVTHPDFRGRGFASRLIEKTLAALCGQGFLFAALIPANGGLFAFYEKFGFSAAFYINETVFSADSVKGPEPKNLVFHPLREARGPLFTRLCLFYAEAYKQTDFCALKSERDFSFFTGDFLLTEGCVYLAEASGGAVAGCAFYHEKTRVVKELLCADAASRDFLLRGIMREHNLSEVKARLTPQKNANDAPFGMARVINAEGVSRALEKFAPDIAFNAGGGVITRNGSPCLGYINLMLND